MIKQEVFRQLVINNLKELGAKPIKTAYDDGWERFELATQVGRLEITVPVERKESKLLKVHASKLLTVFTRFDEPTRAYDRIGDNVNRYSGKWNFHYIISDSNPTVVAEAVIGSIRSIL